MTTYIEIDNLGFDEFFSDDVKSCHIERMRDNHIWVKVITKSGNEFIVWLSSDMSIYGRVQSEIENEAVRTT